MKEIARNYLPNLDHLIVLTKYDVKNYKNKIGCTALNIYNPLSFLTKKTSTQKNKILLYVGRLDINTKGIDTLLKIVSEVFSKVQGWKLLIVGDGEYEKVRSMILKLKLSNQVELIGAIKNVNDYYISSSIFLSTSRWEGFGIVITEAMECGLPVVAFDNLGPKEIITDGEDGYLIPNYDEQEFAKKLMLLMNNEKLREHMSNAAIKKVQSFYPDRIYEQWTNIIVPEQN